MRRLATRRPAAGLPSAMLSHTLLVATMIGLSPRVGACAGPQLGAGYPSAILAHWGLPLPMLAALARYHIVGPMMGQPEVRTHRMVLLAVLTGDSSMNQARKLELITFSGATSETV